MKGEEATTFFTKLQMKELELSLTQTSNGSRIRLPIEPAIHIKFKTILWRRRPFHQERGRFMLRNIASAASSKETQREVAIENTETANGCESSNKNLFLSSQMNQHKTMILWVNSE